MLRNYLLVAIRNFYRNKVSTIINVAGLAVGIAFSLIIALYLQNELTFEQFHEKKDRIYRIGAEYTVSGKIDNFALSSRSAGPLLKKDFPEVKDFVRFRLAAKTLVRVGQDRYSEEGFVFSDPNVFDLFTFPLEQGDPATALLDPNSIVLTARLAEKYFGNQDPIGKVLSTDRNDYTVTGVMEDVPKNSHLKFDALLSFKRLEEIGFLPQSMEEIRQDLWGVGVYTYLLMEENYTPEQFKRISKAFYGKYMRSIGEQINGKAELLIEPLEEIHYYSEMSFDQFPSGNLAYLYATFSIAIFILLLAIINYMNLATARSAGRSREVGMRKVLGSDRKSLIIQFLGEAVIMSLIAFLIALVLVEIVLGMTPFNELVGVSLELSITGDAKFLFYAFLMVIGVGIIAGSYPAFYLSSVQPAPALKGMLKKGSNGLMVRKSLVVFQFAVSVGVVCATWLMYNQISFLRERDLGFEQDHLLLVSLQDSSLNQQLPELIADLEKHPGIISGATALNVPGRTIDVMLYRVEGESGMEEQTYSTMSIGEGYLETMGIEMVEGRDFDLSKANETRGSFLVNEGMVKKMGWQNPIGKRLQAGVSMDGSAYLDGEVVGVVKDFNVKSLHNPLEPLILIPQESPGGVVHLRLENKDLRGTIRYLEDRFQELDPYHPFDYSWLSKEFENLYSEDLRLSILIGILAVVCVFISCLGLLGLASYSIAQRTKEIGIRKVLGASLFQLILLLFKDIFYLILISSLLAWPLSFLAFSRWLDIFALKAPLGFHVFLLTGAGAVLLSFLTVSFHAVKAARANPVTSLKYE